MKFVTKLNGRVMNIQKTKKEGLYMVTLYSDRKLYNVLTENISTKNLDDIVSIDVEIICNKDYIIKEV